MLSFLLLAGAGGLGVADVSGGVLVESPTRLVKPHRKGKTGDTIVLTETLQGYDGTAQDLTGATVRFTLTAPDGTKIVDRVEVEYVDRATGRVRYTVPATVAVPAGVSTFEFEATWDADTILTFPDDSNGEITLIAQLG
jgi:hypothetical protein